LRNSTLKFWPSSPEAISVGSTITFQRVPCHCGNGIIETFEQCDNGASNGQTGQCCDSNCNFLLSNFECNAVTSGPCDIPDFCSGLTSVCVNQIETDGRQCSATVEGETDYCGYCDGTGADNGTQCGVAKPVCPTCESLGNCTDPAHGACSGSGTNITCDCNNNPGEAYTGVTCSIPVCSTLTNCSSCTAHPECGWCCKESVCVPGTAVTGPWYPYNQTCTLSGWQPDRCDCLGSPHNGTTGCINGGSCDSCGFCHCTGSWGGLHCDQVVDCLNIPGGNATMDLCGCNAGNTSCIGCDGKPFGPVDDKCGVCGGDGTSCFEICGYDDCGTCTSAESCGWCVTGVTTGECLETNQDTSSCKAYYTSSGDCALALTTSAVAGITTGVIVAIIIVIVVVLALVCGGSYAGYKYWSKYRSKLGATSSNPLYQEGKGQGTNPLYEQKDQ